MKLDLSKQVLFAKNSKWSKMCLQKHHVYKIAEVLHSRFYIRDYYGDLIEVNEKNIDNFIIVDWF